MGWSVAGTCGGFQVEHVGGVVPGVLVDVRPRRVDLRPRPRSADRTQRTASFVASARARACLCLSVSVAVAVALCLCVSVSVCLSVPVSVSVSACVCASGCPNVKRATGCKPWCTAARRTGPGHGSSECTGWAGEGASSAWSHAVRGVATLCCAALRCACAPGSRTSRSSRPASRSRRAHLGATPPAGNPKPNRPARPTPTRSAPTHPTATATARNAGRRRWCAVDVQPTLLAALGSLVCAVLSW